MLQLIYGRSGTGKTTRMLAQMRACIERGERVMTIVPEQFSFDAEKKWYEALGSELYNRIEAYSFKTLSRHILSLVRHIDSEAIRDIEKPIFLYQAFKQAKREGELRLLAKNGITNQSIDQLQSVISKIRKAGLDSTTLLERSATLPSGLRDKISDIAVLLSYYDRLLEEHGMHDALTDLSESAIEANIHDCFCGYTIFLDEFDGFNGDQYEILEVMLAQSESVTITIRNDEPEFAFSSIFEGANITRRKLLAIARDLQIPYNEEHCQEYFRSSHADLRAVNQRILRGSYHPEETLPDRPHIHMYELRNTESECEWIAAMICDLLREDSELRACDIAIIPGKLGDYGELLQTSLERYHIPYDVSIAKSVLYFDFIQYFLKLVLVLSQKEYQTETMLAFAKTEFSMLDPIQVARLEQYCLSWGINGKEWELPFANESQENRRAYANEQELESLREELITLFDELRDRCDGQSVREVMTVLFDHMEQMRLSGAFRENSQETFARQTALWNLMVEMMDVFVKDMGESVVELSELCTLLHMMVLRSEFKDPPQTLDSVHILEAKRARLNEPKVLFVPGVVEEIFPGEISVRGLFSQAELQQMESVEISIARLFEELYSEEQLVVHKTLSAPKEQLFISYPKVNASGEALEPSVVIYQLQQIFPSYPIHTQDELALPFLVRSQESAYYQFVQNIHKDTGETVALKTLLEQSHFYKERIQKLLELDVDVTHTLSPELVTRLVGEVLRVSPSAINDYFECPFKFMMKRVVRIGGANIRDFGTAELGTLTHACLEVILGKRTHKEFVQLDHTVLMDEIMECATDFAEKSFSRTKRCSERFQFNYRMAQKGIYDVMCHMQEQMQGGGFVPVGFEVKIGGYGGAKKLPTLQFDEARVLLTGTIDRVDQYQVEGETFWRVVDYKTNNNTELDPCAIADGKGMQMLLYLLAIEQAYPEDKSAGVLYVPSGQAKWGDYQDRHNKKKTNTREDIYRLRGLVIEEAMEYMEEELHNGAIPMMQRKAKKDIVMTVNAEQMAKLRKHIHYKIEEMAEHVRTGDMPCEIRSCSDRKLPCEYCDYTALCRAKRELPKRDNAEALEIIFGENTDTEESEI